MRFAGKVLVMSQSGLNSPASMHKDSPVFSGSGVESETQGAGDEYLLWDQTTPDPGVSIDGGRRESPYETDMPVSIEGYHSNTHTQEGNLDPTGGNEAYSGLDMLRFNRCNRDEYFQTNRDRPPALNPSGNSPVDSYRGGGDNIDIIFK